MADAPPPGNRRPALFPGDPLLATKVSIPPMRPGLLPRPRLVERLNDAMHHKLTLLSAPAGFGKTTLLIEWHTSPPGSSLPLAWVSLDARDNDPVRFWMYVIAALDTVRADIGRAALAALQANQQPGQRPPLEASLAVLVNALATIPFDFALALDDYHTLDAPPIHQTIRYLLDHLPPPMHLILAGRTDPPLALARLRASGQIAEFRAPELRFTPVEAAAFLQQAVSPRLSPVDVATLEARTEGWVVGLQLAALSMRGREDVSGFIAAFNGNHRYILDYLSEEVLDRQPADVKSFLLHTCILDRLSGSLCDAVTGRTDGQAMLERLERDNLFVLALDEVRGWYRYHHLFADMLRSRLDQTLAVEVPALHLRAAEWHERNGSRDEAVYHALASGNFDGASRLIEDLATEMLLRGQTSRVRAWLAALPDAYVHARPLLNLVAAWALLLSGHFDAVEPRLREVERDLDALQHSHRRPPHQQGLRADARGAIALARAELAALRGDGAQTIAFCRAALTELPRNSYALRSIAVGYLGTAHWLNGDLSAAEDAVSEAIAVSESAANVYSVLTTIYMLGQLHQAQGKLHQAAAAYERALRLSAQTFGPFPSLAPAHVGLSEVLCEWNNLDGALDHALRAVALGEQGGEPGTLIAAYLALARVRSTRRDHDATRAAVDAAERVTQRAALPPQAAGLVAAWRARLDLRAGNIPLAAAWALRPALSPGNTPTRIRDVGHATRARVLLAQGALDEALRLLEALLLAAEAAGRAEDTIECLVLRALALHAQGNRAGAVTALGRAVALAAPEGYVRLFVDEGVPMAQLLVSLLGAGEGANIPAIPAASSDYVRDLLAALGHRPEQAALPPSAVLSARELVVLRLIAGGASNRDIAQGLVVSLGTVKKHLNNIFTKLGVHSRTQAVARARDLELLPL